MGLRGKDHNITKTRSSSRSSKTGMAKSWSPRKDRSQSSKVASRLSSRGPVDGEKASWVGKHHGASERPSPPTRFHEGSTVDGHEAPGPDLQRSDTVELSDSFWEEYFADKARKHPSPTQVVASYDGPARGSNGARRSDRSDQSSPPSPGGQDRASPHEPAPFRPGTRDVKSPPQLEGVTVDYTAAPSPGTDDTHGRAGQICSREP